MGRVDNNTPFKRGGDNKEEHHVTCTNWIPLYIHTSLESPAHKYVLQLYMYVLFVFSYAGYGLVALFTGVDKHVHYAWSAII